MRNDQCDLNPHLIVRAGLRNGPCQALIWGVWVGDREILIGGNFGEWGRGGGGGVAMMYPFAFLCDELVWHGGLLDVSGLLTCGRVGVDLRQMGV